MIILEGCDCSGKSTLAVRLAEHYGSPITHYSKHDNKVMIKHAQLGAPGTAEIVDRFHLSEPPYSMYFRHETPNYESVDAIDNMLVSGNHLVILCVPPQETVVGLWGERLDQELVKDKRVLEGIYKWYANRAGRYKAKSMSYDWTMDSQSVLIDSIDAVFDDG